MHVQPPIREHRRCCPVSLDCVPSFMILGAHLDTHYAQDAPGGRNMPARDYHRRLFWLCYVYKKDISTGLPPVIDDDHCDLTLPSGYKNIDGFDSFQDHGDLFPGDVRPSIIKSNAIKLLYSSSALAKSNSELVRDIRVLEAELERWRLAIPPPYRPSLAPSYRTRIEYTASKHKKMHIIVIHLDYYSLVASIHSTSGRCRAWANDQVDQIRMELQNRLTRDGPCLSAFAPNTVRERH